MKKIVAAGFALLVAFLLVPSDAGAQAVSASCVAITQTLTVGSTDARTGGQVTKLQTFLQAQGTYTYPRITGYYGVSTQQAVQKWQTQKGIASPGVAGYGTVGPKTRAAISAACGGVVTTPTQSVSFPRTLRIGSTGTDVKALQLFLNKTVSTRVASNGAGSPGMETTYFGPATAAALKKFQTTNKLIANGSVDESTRLFLNKITGSTTAGGTNGASDTVVIRGNANTSVGGGSGNGGAIGSSRKHTIIAQADAGGSVSPGGTISIDEGGNQTLAFTATADYEIADVLVDGSSIGAVSSYTLSSVTTDKTVAVKFSKKPPHTVSGYTITATALDNGSINPGGTVSVAQGGSKTFTFTPATGYEVDSVVIDGMGIAGAPTSYTFSNVTANHTISVAFSRIGPATYTINASAGVGGTISPNGLSTVTSGTSKTYTITPNSGYKIENVKVNGISVGLPSTYTFNNITSDQEISATFTQLPVITYAINSSATNGGTISPSGVTNVTQGGSATYTITPATGYKIGSVTVDGINRGALSTYTFTNVTAAHTIVASFSKVFYTISATAGTGGSISPSGSVSATQGANQTFTITPAAGQQIANVSVDGVNQGAISSYTFTNIAANHTIAATFTTIPVVNYTITATAGTGGSISPAGSVSVAQGGSNTFSIVPAVGYRINQVLVNGVNQGAISSYTFSNVNSNQTISASFVPVTYTISATAGTGGSVSPSGTVTVNNGAVQNFTVTPNNGYQISSVTIDGVSQTIATTYSFTDISSNHTMTILFSLIPNYTVTATAGTGGSVTPTSVSVQSGASQSFTITPNSGYQVSDITVDGALQTITNPFVLSNITSNKTVAVTFSQTTPPPTSGGTTYYVAPTGSDSANGSSGSPWKTLQKAADSVVAGDTVVVRAGNYAGFNIAKSGTSGKPITFSAQSGAIINSPLVMGSNNYGINASGQSYITIDGFTCTPSGGRWFACVRFGGLTSNVWLQGNIVRNVTAQMRTTGTPDQYGIYVAWQDGVIVENNTVNGTDNSGIYAASQSRNYIIRDNRVSGSLSNGIHNNGNPGTNLNGLIENNIVSNVGTNGGHAIGGDGMQNSTIRNNLVYNTKNAKGIALFKVDAPTNSTGNTVVNNTVVPGSAAAALRLNAGSNNNTIFNNIFIGSTWLDDSTGGGSTLANNVTSSSGGGTNSVVSTASAVFTNSAANDYTLKSTSPAVNAGAATFNSKSAPTTDMLGASRPQNAVYDAGAYEFGGTVPPPTTDKFAVGDRVQVISTVNVRATASPTGTLLGSQNVGALGSVLGGPVDNGGYTWWNVNYDSGADGWSIESNLTESTTPPPVNDTTAPTVPTNFTATAQSSSEIALSWTASTDANGVTGYRIYRNGASTPLTTVTGTSYTDSGLSASTAYSYTVSAFDAAGNASAKTTSKSATTLAETTPPPTSGTTYYMAPNGSDTTGDGSYAKPWATFSKAFTVLKGGQTLVLKNGTYTGSDSKMRLFYVGNGTIAPPNGIAPSGSNPAVYTRIVAETDGGAVIDNMGQFNAIEMAGPPSRSVKYIEVRGIVFRHQARTARIYGGTTSGSDVSYLKFIRDGFEDAGSGDNVTFDITHDAHHILVEESYAWGSGRYKFATYHANNVIFRRTVARQDVVNPGGEPLGIYSFYASDKVECQNCIAIDSDKRQYWTNVGEYGAAFYMPSTDGPTTNSAVRGSISLNNDLQFIGLTKYHDNILIENSVGWHVREAGLGRNSALYNHVTVGDAYGPGVLTPTVGFYYNPSGDTNTNTLTNSIMTKVKGTALNSFASENYNVFFGNNADRTGGTPTGARSINADPGLKYITRTIDGSAAIRGTASDQTDRGANVLYRIGVSGTFYGEPGYNTVTSESLWPFPYEDVIARDFRSYSAGGLSGNRGFAANGSLTNYIWTYLGSPMPASFTEAGPATPDTQAPSTPTGLTATAQSQSQISLSWNGSSDNVGISGYRIYRNGSQINTTTGTSFTDSGLAAATSYSYTVAAYDTAGNVSGQSSASSATTQSAAVSDTSAPSIPTGLDVVAASSSQINLTWTASNDNVGVVGYRVYRNGSQIATPSGTSYSDTGLSPATTYSYRVAAYDAAGNVSSQSSSASTATQAGGTTPPPSTGSNLSVSSNIARATSVSACQAGSNSVTTSSFTAPANSLIVVAVNADSNRSALTINLTNSGTPLTWTRIAKQEQTDNGGSGGYAGAYYAVVSSSQTLSVTANLGNAACTISVKPYIVTGADLSSPIGAIVKGSSATNNLTTTAYTSTSAGSNGFAIGSDWTQSGLPVSSDIADSFDSAGNVSGISVYKSSNTTSSGSSVSYNLDAGGSGAVNWNWVAFEVKPSTSLSVIQTSRGLVAGTETVCVVLNNRLVLGSSDASTNGEVTLLQTFLKAQGDYTYPEITGYFGAVTKAAVEAFQARTGLEVVGEVGTLTRAKIQALSCGY